MAVARGVGLFELFGVPRSGPVTSLLPDIERAISGFDVLTYESAISDGSLIHTGVLQATPIETQAAGAERNTPVLDIPAASEGLPFRLFIPRQPIAAGEDVEAPQGDWTLQVDVPEIRVRLPRPPFVAARYVPETLADPARLAPWQGDNPPPIVLSMDAGILEISSAGRIAARADFTLTPDAETGFLQRFRFTAPDFYIAENMQATTGGRADNLFGLRVGEVLLDFSSASSPEVARQAGFGDDWMGAYIAEVTFLFPRNTPWACPKVAAVRRMLIGNGFAGNFLLDFERSANPPPRPRFFRISDTGELAELAIDENHAMDLGAVLPPAARVVGVADVNPPWEGRRRQARWTGPDGQIYSGARTPPMAVRPGDTIEYGYAPADDFEQPNTQVFWFLGASLPGVRLRLRDSGGRTFEDVTFISAGMSWLEGASLVPYFTPEFNEGAVSWMLDYEAPSYDTELRYALTRLRGARSLPDTVLLPSSEDALHAPDSIHRRTVRSPHRVGVSAHGFRRFVMVDVVGGDPPTLIVSEARALLASDGSELSYSGAGPVYHLPSALVYGSLRQLRDSPAPALVPGEEPAGGSRLDAASLHPNRLYELYPAALPAPEPAPEPVAEPVYPTLIAIYFERDHPQDDELEALRSMPLDQRLAVPSPAGELFYEVTTIPVAGGQFPPLLGRQFRGQEDPARLPDAPRRWPADLSEPLARFDRADTIVIIGRTSTLGDSSPRIESRNLGLESRRAEYVRQLLEAALAGRIAPQALRPSGETQAAGGARQADSEGVTYDLPSSVEAHRQYERADVDLEGVQFLEVPHPPPPMPAPVADQQRVLVPVLPIAAPPAEFTPATTGRLRRLRAEAEWNRNPFPTKLELVTVWNLGGIPVPTDSTGATTQSRTPALLGAPAGETDLLRVLLRLIYDARSNQFRFVGQVDNAGDADGLARADDIQALGILLLFGPVLAARVPTDPTAAAVTTYVGGSALLSAAALLTAPIGGGQPIVRGCNFILNGLSFELEGSTGAGEGGGGVDRVLLSMDYSIEFSVDTGAALGIRSRDPVRIRYRNVGLAIDTQLPGDSRWWEHFHFRFDPAADMEVERSGNFQIDGPLGNLLRITGTRLGSGSTFLELDLAFALNTGVIEINRATVRITFSEGVSVELRGLRVTVNIPNTLEGSGALTIGDGGRLSAELDLRVIPAGLRVAGALVISPHPDFTSIALAIDVELPTGIPLLSTGLGVYGFLGRFAGNMRRDIALPAENRVAAELDWFRRILNVETAATAWRDEDGVWGFGVGAVVGTLPDAGRSFHAKGLIVLELPGPTLVFGIDAAFLQQRRKSRGDDLSGTITGAIVIDPAAILIAIEVDLQLAGILQVTIPIGAFFPFPADGAPPAYLRIGSDNIAPRTGNPVSVTVMLPALGRLARAFAYLMIEERELLTLGGVAGLDFHGFSIGFGFGIEIRWGGDAIHLRASALLLVGMGTSPFALAGKLSISGSLKILVVSLAASADLDFRYSRQVLPDGTETDDYDSVFTGEFCGEVSFFFFTIRGCVSVELGGGNPYEVPPPPNLISGMGLIDRRGQQIASAPAGEVADDGAPTVWPDTVPVLHFAHAPETELEAASPFQVLPCEREGDVHVGDFLYRFRLTNLTIEKGPDWIPLAGPFDAAWWFPSHRPAFVSADGGDTPPSGEEARELGLLSWSPFPWSALLDAEAQQPTLDDLGEGIDNVCDPSPQPARLCALFGEAKPGPGDYEWRTGAARSSYRATVTGQTLGGHALPGAVGILRAAGLQFRPAERVRTPHPDYKYGLRLASGRVAISAAADLPVLSPAEPPYGLPVSVSFDTRLELSRTLVSATLLVAYLSQPSSTQSQEVIRTEKTQEGFPVVRYVAEGGSERAAKAGAAGEFNSQRGVYRLVLYSAPEKQGVRGWRVRPFAGDTILLRVCGIDHDQYEQAAENNEARADWRTGLISVTAAGGESRFVLDPDSTYRVRATWQWSGIHEARRADTEPEDWPHDERTQSFVFRTAPYGIEPVRSADGEQVRRTTLDQDQFDPRTLASYISRMPSLSDAPVLLMDTVEVVFLADHIETLLQRYGRELRLELIRTDVAHDAAFDGRIPVSIEWTPKPGLEVDRFLADRIAKAPCLGGAHPPFPGAAAGLRPDFAPLAAYDLVVSAPDPLDAEEPLADRLIARAPFRTSRYRDADELLAALGFGPVENGTPTKYVLDHVVDASPAIDALPANDHDLNAALALLGMDELEPPKRACTTGIWRHRADGWHILGFLLDAPEPVQRPERLAITGARLGMTSYSVVRLSASGSRLLLWTDSSAALTGETVLQLDIVEYPGTARETRLTRARVIAPLPVMARWEV